MARKILEGENYRVITATNSSDAVGLYYEHRHEIDLVLLDLYLNEVHISEVLEQILTINNDARVLFTSGRTTEQGAEQSISKGAVGFIQKPYRVKQLIKTIEEVCKAEST
jgi:DNA-binding NtrC family response regulator